MFTYHYYAMHQEKPGRVHHFDGLVDSETRIMEASHYKDLKRAIWADSVAKFVVDSEPSDMTLCSLTLLGEA